MGAIVKQEDDDDKPADDEQPTAFDALDAALADARRADRAVRSRDARRSRDQPTANGEDDTDDGRRGRARQRTSFSAMAAFGCNGDGNPARAKRDPWMPD